MSQEHDLGGKMTGSSRVPATEVTGLVGTVVKVATRKMFGRVPDPVGVMWHHPAVFKDLMGINRKADKWHELDENLASYAHMAAAGAIGCSFCLDLNYFLSHSRGLDDAKAREV